MNAIRKAGALLLGTALMAGCTERNAPTALRNRPGVAFATATQTSLVSDPVGDVPNGTPGWQDIYPQASMAKKGQTFVMTVDLAGDVPPTPPVPSGGTEAAHIWIWGFDTDAEALQSSKDGVFPSGPGQATPYEFFATVEWNGTRFSGVLYDLTRDPVVPVPGQQFTITEKRVTLSVAASALGDPSTFGWGVATCTRHYDKFGAEGFQCFDRAPDNDFVTWPE